MQTTNVDATLNPMPDMSSPMPLGNAIRRVVDTTNISTTVVEIIAEKIEGRKK